MFLDFKLKVIHFYRRNKKKIYIVALALGITISVNIYLGYLKSVEPPSTGYTPHVPIISGEEVGDKKTKNTIEDEIGKYMDFCNNKDYKSAFDCLTEDCKKYKFKNSLQEFKNYVDYVFDEKKVYSIQNITTKDNVYIYKVEIIEDILATGMNNEDSDWVYDEYVVMTKDGDNFKFAVDGYIKDEKIEGLTYEDEYMLASVIERITTYDQVTYRFRVKNKTQNDIVIANTHDNNELVLSLNGDYRIFKDENLEEKEVVAYNGNTIEFTATFKKYFDESKEETDVIFNKVRVLKDYSGIDQYWEKELKDTVKAYSVTFPLK